MILVRTGCPKAVDNISNLGGCGDIQVRCHAVSCDSSKSSATKNWESAIVSENRVCEMGGRISGQAQVTTW